MCCRPIGIDNFMLSCSSVSFDWRKFLRHVIPQGGIAIDPSKIEVVHEWKFPKSVFEIRSFLGLAGYYRRFIEGFSTLAFPLTKLTRKGQAFVWDTNVSIVSRPLRKD